jgi:hypothetical protein
MTNTANDTRRDWLFGIGVMGVSLAAAVSSYAGLSGLADLVGWNHRLALLLPLTIDAYAITATRVWLSKSTRSAKARRWAKSNTIGAIATSVAGNAVSHAANAHVFHVTWPIVVAVSAIPSIVLGLIVHLWHLATVPETSAPTGSPAETDTDQATDTPARPEPGTPSEPRTAASSGAPASKPTGTRKAAPAKKRTGKATGATTAALSDDELLDAARLLGAELGAMPTATRLVNSFGVGTGRARKLAAILAAEPIPTDPTTAPDAEASAATESTPTDVPVSA